ncbi:PdxA family dehydrogenase [Paracoccus onubensis]|uniref:4-hydroxythreonine-4-phosphate dehydrogenase n=1 Tax=Paracoccus onubensis TaxID=1675788 RepID=A0A418SUM0_9RHOB|nr:4-hydroxythreonine-4-phosphate dehydrogenase PdxA [Paracoccus onubensis]RJE84617.1 4-hydroxythreonine-4-phosphate dehydrogenase [Paracoccus onubensis]
MNHNIDQNRPIIALTSGDCTGIGPEITAKLLANPALREVARFLVIGDRRVIEQGMKQAGTSFPVAFCATPADADWTSDAVQMIDLGNTDPGKLPIGAISAESGFRTGETLARAIEFAKTGQVDAISFAPLNKRAMFDGGWKFPDEHKMFAKLLGHRGYFSEMNVLHGQWMSRVTSHVSLREALEQINETSIADAITLAHETMQRAGIGSPRIAVAALNPHAGENGLFGREEIDLIGPVVQKMAAAGYDCKGPFPADTIYLKAFAGDYDSVVAMYHDQGQIATKLRGFNQGVTVTAGLDVVFTTPAHGTAYDIVGTGTASPEAFETAIRLAAQLVVSKPAQAAISV